MGQGANPHTRSAIQVVRAMWLAHRHGRIDEMLAFLHPDIVWRPLATLDQNVYQGQAEVLAMLEEYKHRVGDFRMDFDEVIELPDGRVRAVGRVVHMAEDEVGDPRATIFTLRDGLVIAVDGELETPA